MNSFRHKRSPDGRAMSRCDVVRGNIRFKEVNIFYNSMIQLN